MGKRRFQNAMALSFRDEINDAITEDLFRTSFRSNKCFLPLPESNQRIGYYVAKRYDRSTNCVKKAFSAENDFFGRYWPRRGKRSAQILLVLGREGIGKSTFLQYFFRHFLPYYYEQDTYNEIQDGPASEWEDVWLRHIVLCSNLQRVSAIEEMYATMYEYFASQLLSTSKWTRGAGAWNGDEVRTATDSAIATLARRTDQKRNGEERKFFITWIIDNTDLMTERLQLDLLNSAINRVREAIPERDPYDPIESREDELWKIIIPLRPETYNRLAYAIHPFGNKEVWYLDPVTHEELDSTRGKLLEDLIIRTDRHVEEMIWPEEERVKPPIKLTTAAVAGRALRDSFAAQVDDLEGDVPAWAQHIYDDLVDGSVRRYLWLRRRLALSNTINSRLAQGKQDAWSGPRLSHFYFLDGLLCGESGIYEATEDDNLILNLYDVGADPTHNGPYSLLVGVHLISLLRDETNWDDARHKLEGLGYPPIEIEHASACLIQKGAMKFVTETPNGTDRYQIETPIIRAHWNILRERAYTDNVAISLGVKMGLASESESVRTISVEYGDFSRRVSHSCAFLRRLQQAQNMIANPNTARVRHQKDNDDFREHLQKIGLPDVYKYAGAEYRKRGLGVIKGNLRDYLSRHGELLTVSARLRDLPEEYKEGADILRMVIHPR
jgi:hypothetical protein